jgi:ankyrin repeat protein
VGLFPSVRQILHCHCRPPATRDANIEADTEGYTTLHAAAHFGHKSVDQILIDKGVKIDSAAMRRETPLVLAASKGHDDIIDLILKQQHNISIKAKASNALHSAACNSHLASVRRLLKEVVDVNLKDDDGQTTLDAAAGRP